MKKMNLYCMKNFPWVFSLGLMFVLTIAVGCATSGSSSMEASPAASGQATAKGPMTIPDDVSCGKCGMFPAKYPRWQSQIIFNDGAMTPFDGCKCMFNFLFAMEKFDQTHTGDDVSAIWVKDFNTGEWLTAKDAYYVVGSDMMGPMGKELIPFSDLASAQKFQGEQNGSLMKYTDINPDVMKTLGMGGMKMEHGAKPMKM